MSSLHKAHLTLCSFPVFITRAGTKRLGNQRTESAVMIPRASVQRVPMESSASKVSKVPVNFNLSVTK